MTDEKKPERALVPPGRVDLTVFEAMARRAASTAPTASETRAAAERLEPENRDERLTRSGIRGAITPEDFRAVVTGRFGRNTHALDAVRRWYAMRSQKPDAAQLRVLALVGLTGRGKTVAGAWLLGQIGGRYITAEDLRRMVRSTDHRDGEELAKLISTRCVVLDDAGTEGEVDSQAAMFKLVNARAGHARAWTLITANLAEADFRARYDGRTVRRIEHSGAIVEVEGSDLRRGGR